MFPLHLALIKFNYQTFAFPASRLWNLEKNLLLSFLCRNLEPYLRTSHKCRTGYIAFASPVCVFVFESIASSCADACFSCADFILHQNTFWTGGFAILSCEWPFAWRIPWALPDASFCGGSRRLPAMHPTLSSASAEDWGRYPAGWDA